VGLGRLCRALAVLTALAYMLPTSVGKDYGSFTDYLGAFALGATAPTVFNWALSRLVSSTKATSPSAHDAGKTS